ncbi:hypothetical protein CAPTEDRAFT_191601 [Capitella teleta]|uniref:Uncharacterized protein n=1 Tax=Capitella teleta TaxID=283909 RepID=R7V9T5_CAPTE|nr:hypothetical protein CAPTEDRAFT_191601 [Capitella teleta]|eukprot:ELU15354.1 hypothetical protein CAPTEDRAFT_191601 [Capitella teleta]
MESNEERANFLLTKAVISFKDQPSTSGCESSLESANDSNPTSGVITDISSVSPVVDVNSVENPRPPSLQVKDAVIFTSPHTEDGERYSQRKQKLQQKRSAEALSTFNPNNTYGFSGEKCTCVNVLICVHVQCCICGTRTNSNMTVLYPREFISCDPHRLLISGIGIDSSYYRIVLRKHEGSSLAIYNKENSLTGRDPDARPEKGTPPPPPSPLPPQLQKNQI